ncbi:YqjK-like family protein [Ferribacterium limneticum]|uniref:YqjK-like family protein n=1 Tax=Ferribacterium limneticum TaxID=76259 RepID=UPI001CF9F00A|nr:YqjK-like family protein [Ferribacterium limneticum]UCV28666.1 YqjK-like family protein [Ferribacterium limneticum]UCV32583.1 YqjK-like family protein [Ferribacterium limneticum]
MNPKLLELATRHGALKARIDEQRRQLARHVEPLQGALAKGDTVLKGVDWLKHHPAAVGLAVAAAVIARPKRAWRWGRRSFLLWRGWQALKSAVAGGR